MTEQPLFDAPPPKPDLEPKPAPVRCEEPGCGRPIWAKASIRAGPDGRKRGRECRRRYNAARRRISIADRPAWDVPGQLAITDQEETVTSPTETLSAAAARLRETPDRPLDIPLAALLEKAAGDLDREVTEETPDCCGETHDKPGLYHYDGCGGWLTVYRGHGGPDDGCRCWDLDLAVARAVLGQNGGGR